MRARAGIAPHPHAQRIVEAWIAEARRRVGPGPARAAWAAGEALPPEAALDDALTGRSPPRRGGPAGDGAGGPLTRREREVAALVAAGLSNREIAARLVITERTAENHVAHILDRLGFRTRVQIAAWATERGLRRAGAEGGREGDASGPA